MYFINRDPFQSFFNDPFDFDDHVSRRINEALNSRNVNNNSGNNKSVSVHAKNQVMPNMRTPRIDLVENGDNYIIRADLPGIRKEDVAIKIKGDILTIEGTRKNEYEEKTETSHVIERSFGRFVRDLKLPTDVNLEDANATMDNGVLELKIKKKAVTEQEMKRINIQ